jgi:hypothetical protein
MSLGFRTGRQNLPTHMLHVEIRALYALEILTEADNDLAPKAHISVNFPSHILDDMDMDLGESSIGTLVAFIWSFPNLESSQRIL